jgi:hypothetical protein
MAQASARTRDLGILLGRTRLKNFSSSSFLYIVHGLAPLNMSAGASDRSSRVNARAKGLMKGESRIQQLDAPLHTKLSASPSISSLVDYSTLCT